MLYIRLVCAGARAHIRCLAQAQGALAFDRVQSQAAAMDAIFAQAKAISDRVVLAVDKKDVDEAAKAKEASKTPFMDAAFPALLSIFGQAPRTPPAEPGQLAPVVRIPRLPTPKSVGLSNVEARKRFAAKMSAVDQAPVDGDSPSKDQPAPALAAAPLSDDDSPSTEYEAFVPKTNSIPSTEYETLCAEDVAEAEARSSFHDADDTFCAEDVAEADEDWDDDDTEEDKPYTTKRHRQAAYTSAPWHTSAAASSSFHRTAGATATGASSSWTTPSSTMWHEAAAEETPQASQDFSCSRLNRDGRARPRGGKKRELEAAMHGGRVSPRIWSTKPGGILVPPPKRNA
jgi:hypothetical protein